MPVPCVVAQDRQKEWLPADNPGTGSAMSAFDWAGGSPKVLRSIAHTPLLLSYPPSLGNWPSIIGTQDIIALVGAAHTPLNVKSAEPSPVVTVTVDPTRQVPRDVFVPEQVVPGPPHIFPAVVEDSSTLA